MATTALKTASVLAFERKLDPSDALLYACAWDQRGDPAASSPIAVRLKSVRGTISNRLKAGAQDPAKLNAAIDKPNLQKVDVAALPDSADTVKVVFTLRVLGGTGKPSACNGADYQAKLLSTVQGYVQANGFAELGRRYAHNLANGRFLWRNRVGAEQVEVHIEQLVQGQAAQHWTFDALQLSLRDFDASGPAAESLKAVSELLTSGLAGDSHVLLRVTAYARIGHGQEVYPSQELILEKDTSNKSKTLYEIGGDEAQGPARSKKSKTLYVVRDVAGIHSQKIGNALRTIDTWHPEVAELGPIAIEPYGSVTTLGKACRRPTDKLDFYNLLDNWLLKDKVPALEQQHFVMAILVRGGVFGEAN
jgi:CRISPR-associated protein Csy3